MIRPATLDDIPALLDLGEEFAREAGVIERTGWNEQDVSALLVTLIESPDGIVMVSESGMIGGYVAGHPFNQETRMFVELFWRAKDGQGKALLEAAEAAARARGASKSIMVAMHGMERTERLYGRLNYRPVEAQFMKELD